MQHNGLYTIQWSLHTVEWSHAAMDAVQWSHEAIDGVQWSQTAIDTVKWSHWYKRWKLQICTACTKLNGSYP